MTIMRCKMCGRFSSTDGYNKLTLAGEFNIVEHNVCRKCFNEYEIRREERERVMALIIKKYINGYMEAGLTQKYKIEIREYLEEEDKKLFRKGENN